VILSVIHQRQNLLESVWSWEDTLTDWPSVSTWLTCAASIINIDHDDWDRTDLADVCFYFNHVEAEYVRKFQCFLEIYKYLPYPPSPSAQGVWSLRRGVRGAYVQIHAKESHWSKFQQRWLPKGAVCVVLISIFLTDVYWHVGVFLPSLMHACPRHGPWASCIRLSDKKGWERVPGALKWGPIS
jgi:hypothetical protein